MILSLGLIVAASQPLRDNGVFTLVMEPPSRRIRSWRSPWGAL